ncbi:hypothetical protein ACHAXR_004016 [Thalassiosira sp. AJA248-18]
MLSKIAGAGARKLYRASSSSVVVAERSLFVSTSHHVPLRSTASLNAIDRMTNQELFNSKHNNYQQYSAFSTKTQRRRRRGGGGTPAENDSLSDASAGNNSTSSSTTAGHSAALTAEQFLSASQVLLDKVESAVAKLKDCNDGLIITRYPPSSSASTESTNNGTPYNTDEEDDDSDPNYHQQHGGQLSIQVESSGDVYWGGGTYWLIIEPGSNDGTISAGFVTLRSPLSGTFTYCYNSSTGEWVGTEDGHSLLGMLTRDWIRQCQGVPDL